MTKIQSRSPPDTEEESKTQYSRWFSLSSYLSVSDLDGFLRMLPWVQHWAYIYHDNDIYPEDHEKAGQVKEPHTHILLYTYSAKTSSSIEKKFIGYAEELAELRDTKVEKTMVQICSNNVAMFRYFTHKDDPDKYQYDESDIVHDSLDFWEKPCYKDKTYNKGLAMFNDLLEGIGTLDMVKKYGKEYIYHSQHLKGVVVDYQREIALTEIHCQDRGIFYQRACNVLSRSEAFTGDQKNMFSDMLCYVLANWNE